MESSSVDKVVTTWTLCTIPDVDRALEEMLRVLKPSGRLLFVEHGLASKEGASKWQNRLTPAWKCISGGCHLNRPILSLIENAGFKINEMDTGYAPGPKFLTYLFEGGARINRKVYFPFNCPQDFAYTSARLPSDDRHGREVLKLGGIIEGRKFRTAYPLAESVQ